MLAQAGGILLVALVWAAVFTKPLLPLFSPHPLLQSLGVFTVLQAILIVQPTSRPADKAAGAQAHALLNLLSFLLFTAGVAVIETNKERSHNAHFHSVHGCLGVATAVVLLVQYLFGFLIYGVPAVLGGLDRARALWKYHRYNGYVLFVLVLATVVSAVYTDYNKNVLDIQLWSVLVAVVLVVAGVFPRIQLAKLGIHPQAHSD